MQIDDALLDAVGPSVDPLTLLAAAPLQTMEAEKVAVLGLHNVLLCFVAPKLAELDEIGCISNGIGNG